MRDRLLSPLAQGGESMERKGIEPSTSALRMSRRDAFRATGKVILVGTTYIHRMAAGSIGVVCAALPACSAPWRGQG